MSKYIGRTVGVVKWTEPLFAVRVPRDLPETGESSHVEELVPAHEVLANPRMTVRGDDAAGISLVARTIYPLLDRQVESEES